MGLEFKDVLKERLEIEFTKRLFRMIPSKDTIILILFRGVNINAEASIDTKV
jgi:hypothetical protein